MAKPELLDNVTHMDLRVITRHGAEFGDNINQVAVFPTEFAQLQREYPIFFRRTETGFQAVTILGLDPEENLYLEGDDWRASYIPAIQQRGPFLIGFQERLENGQPQNVPVIHVDVAHPRISRSEGDPLFKPQGGNAPRLEMIARALRTIHAGTDMAPAMFAAFQDEGLMAPLEVDVQLDDSTQYKIPDLFSISAEALASLDGAALERLNRKGFLALAFYVRASIDNMQRLIAAKNRKHGL